MKRLIPFVMVLFGLFSCGSSEDLETVKMVDLEKYSGTWYEIARLPNSFESGIKCITATYTIKENGTLVTILKKYSFHHLM